MLLMIDNYDSFTYNVVQYLAELGADVNVIRNDELTVAEIEALNPERIVVSPGPLHANRSRRVAGGDRALCRQAANSWRVPGPSEHWPGLWR